MRAELDLEVMWEKAVRAQPIAPIYGRCVLFGWSVRETTGAAGATVRVLNGGDATGLEVIAANLNPSGVARDWLGPQGIRTDVGIWPVTTGTVAGTLWVWTPEE